MQLGMSALGQKQTRAAQKVTSALPPKADICSAQVHVRFVPIADIRRYCSIYEDYHLDVAQLRSELNMAGLRRYTPQETGCMQHVYCEEQ